ncbi:MAG: hypothetical protein C4520_09970 [Candidatus Abyssobacteria bacterium SURF_5]|uniref:Uncharacterized protein n=1 Tax=Abyssobacteria bacterium (strain SURF_5) TaxID=2093360 RepID=A0A3A4P0F3_ABYX5|nr:MAG: hypothetical protein C4520_09970 [Candidatus Abyssubacteria bacterium SURF_5]
MNQGQGAILAPFLFFISSHQRLFTSKNRRLLRFPDFILHALDLELGEGMVYTLAEFFGKYKIMWCMQ